jgi:hypothetical protein
MYIFVYCIFPLVRGFFCIFAHLYMYYICGLWPLWNTTSLFLTWYQSRFSRDRRRRQFAPASLSPVPVLAAGLLPILVSISFISVLSCSCWDRLAASHLLGSGSIGRHCPDRVDRPVRISVIPRSPLARPRASSSPRSSRSAGRISVLPHSPLARPRASSSPAGPGLVLPRSVSRQGLVLAQLARSVSPRIGRGQPELTVGGLCFARICS